MYDTEQGRLEGDHHGTKKDSGRKGRLDHNILSYYRESLNHLEYALSSGNGIDEDTELLLSSVFDSLVREGRQLSQNQTGSRLAESLVGLADWPRLAQLVSGWSDHWAAIVEDRFAHRVLQAAIKRYLGLRLAGGDAAGGSDGSEGSPGRVWGPFAVHMRLHYPEYLEHTYACHALRSYLLLLAGVLVDPATAAAARNAGGDDADQQAAWTATATKHESYDPCCAVLVDPPLELDGVSLTDELDQLAGRFLENKHVLSLIDSEVTGPFLQVLMLVLKLRMPKRFRKFFKHLMKESGLFDATCEVMALEQTFTLSSLLCNSRACYFLEQLLSLLSPKQLRRFIAAHVAGREAGLAAHPSANFVLQRAIAVCSDPAYLADCVASASGCVAGGWLRLPGRQMLAVRLARRCRQLAGGPAQTALSRAVAAAAAAEESPLSGGEHSLFESLAAFGTGGGGGAGGAGGGAGGAGGGFNSGMAGCQLLAELFQFPDTRRLCASLLAVPADRLSAACRCPRANRAIEACLASGSVPMDTKLALCDRLLDSITDLCCHKSGSRVSDALWANGDHRMRERVAGRLAEGGLATFERLRRDRYGRFAYQRFAPELFARRPGDWRQLQARLDAQMQRRVPPLPRATLEAAAERPSYKAKPAVKAEPTLEAAERPSHKAKAVKAEPTLEAAERPSHKAKAVKAEPTLEAAAERPSHKAKKAGIKAEAESMSEAAERHPSKAKADLEAEQSPPVKKRRKGQQHE